MKTQVYQIIVYYSTIQRLKLYEHELPISECRPMTAPNNGYVRGNMVSVGSNVVLGCDKGFINLGQACGTFPVQSGCQYNDTHSFWTKDSIACVQGTSYIATCIYDCYRNFIRTS